MPVSFTSSDNSIATVTPTGTPGVYTVHIVSAGSVTITAQQAGSNTYVQATDVSQVLSIGKANQVITFPLPIPVIPVTGASTTVGATSSAGLPITYTLSDPGLASLSGNKLTFTGSGTLVITANQPGNADYNPAPPVSDTLQIFSNAGFVSGIGVFPNPAHGTLHIRMSQDYQITKVIFFDLRGRVVLGQDNFEAAPMDIQLNIGSLMPGIYLLRVVAIRDHSLVYPVFKIEVQ